MGCILMCSRTIKVCSMCFHLELLKDYDMSVLYHPGKANIVADALSRVSMGSVLHVVEGKKELARDVHRLARLGVRLFDSAEGSIGVQSSSPWFRK